MSDRLLDAQGGPAGDAQVSVFGYPGNPPRQLNGAWSSCALRGTVGGGLIQLDTDSESALRAQPGYSGAPVVVRDRWGDAVVGMQAGVFVGREREVKRLRDMVKAQPLVMVTGPSGVGKSSLVAAGVQPALAGDGWMVVSFRPGRAPYEAVARALLELERPGGHGVRRTGTAS